MSTLTMKDPIELHKAGIKALNTALGYEDAQAFLMQYRGSGGDFTKDRHKLHTRSFGEVTADILKLQKERPETLTAKRAKRE